MDDSDGRTVYSAIQKPDEKFLEVEGSSDDSEGSDRRVRVCVDHHLSFGLRFFWFIKLSFVFDVWSRFTRG